MPDILGGEGEGVVVDRADDQTAEDSGVSTGDSRAPAPVERLVRNLDDVLTGPDRAVHRLGHVVPDRAVLIDVVRVDQCAATWVHSPPSHNVRAGVVRARVIGESDLRHLEKPQVSH
jgi:hypothetical protein